LGVVFAVCLTLPSVAGAHGTGWEQKELGDSTAVYFFYSDGTPMSYSSVSVFSPENSEIAYQKANTDKSGWFVFKPSAPCLWKFSVNDGQGHLAEGEINVEPIVPAPVAAGAGTTGTEAAGELGSSEAAMPSPIAASPPPARPLASSKGSGPSPGILEVILGLSVILNLTLAAFLFRKKRKIKAQISPTTHLEEN
jgi:hypothetical protein